MAIYDITGKVIKADTKKKKKKITTGQKILGTAGTLATEIGRGFLGTTEGLADLALYGASGLSKLAGSELLSTSFREAAQQDTTKKFLTPAAQTYRPTTVTKKGGLTETVASGVGQVGAMLGGSRLLPQQLASFRVAPKTTALGKLSIPTVTALSSAGSGISEAYRRGAATQKAVLYGTGKGAIEGITEGLFGGLGQTFNKLTGGAALDDAIVGKLTRNITNKLGKRLAEVGIKSAGEGVEEVIAGALEPILQKATIETGKSLSELYKDTNLLSDFIVGSLVSGIVQAPSLVNNNGKVELSQEAQQIKQAIQEPLQAVPQTLTQEQAIKDLEKGTVTVYSSKPIVNGNFVSTSRNQAQDYAGGGEIYSKEVPIQDVAWINGDEGQYAKIEAQDKPQEALEKIEQQVEQPKQRKTVQTIATSESIADDKKIQELLSKVDYQYSPQTNVKTVDQANQTIAKGYDTALKEFNGTFDSNARVKPQDIALGERLIQEAKKKGDYATVVDLVTKVATLGTELGQATQALSIIRRLTPEGQLKVLTNQLERLKSQDAKGLRKVKGIQDIEVTPQMAEKVLKAESEQELADAMDEVKQEIADQLPPSFRDKVNAWRYFAMLGNPKTHVRNIVGNITMGAVTKVKNQIARTIENTVQKYNPKVFENENRTRTFKQATQDVKNYTNQVSEELAKEQNATSKFVDGDTILDKKRSTNIKALQKLYDVVGDALTVEDTIFRNYAFKQSFSEYLTANGIKTQADIEANPNLIQQAKSYATEQSMYAVFQQYSALASYISNAKRGQNKALQFAFDALIPFTKTPINIATTATRYSPAGLMWTMTKGLTDVRNGKITATKFIDDISKGLSGSAIMGIGFILANMGLLSGGEDKEKEGQYEKALGKQPYSLKLGDKTFTIDWLVPASMPLLVGAEMFNAMKDGEFGVDGNAILDTVTQTIDPMISLSFLQGLNNAMGGFDQNKFGGIVTESIKSYVGQFVPTIGGQIAKTLDKTVRSSSASQDSPFKPVEEIIRSNMQKIPFASKLLEPATDLWGNEVQRSESVVQRAIENFLLPSQIREDISTATDNELKRLYKESGEDSVLPSAYLRKYVQYKNEKFETNAKQYTKFKKIYGKEAYSKLQALFKTSTYQEADREEKVKLVEQVYKYATDEAKKDFLSQKGTSYTNATKNGNEYYKVNPIVNTIENNISLEASKYQTKYPEKYNSVTMIADYDTYNGYQDKINEIRENLKGASSEERKQETFNYINKLPLSSLKKQMLFKQYYSSYKDADKKILEAINKLKISKSEKLDIAKDYGFTIKNGIIKL